MLKRSSKQERLPDPVEWAQRVIRHISGEEPPADGKNPHAVAMGKLGGKKGGKARAAALTKKQRSAIAKKAAAARWSRKSV